MDERVATAGRVAGLLGIALCILAVVLRFTGHVAVSGVSAMSLLQGGTTGVVVGCFLLLLARPRGS